jgi:hypothetical protein
MFCQKFHSDFVPGFPSDLLNVHTNGSAWSKKQKSDTQIERKPQIEREEIAKSNGGVARQNRKGRKLKSRENSSRETTASEKRSPLASKSERRSLRVTGGVARYFTGLSLPHPPQPPSQTQGLSEFIYRIEWVG